MFSVGILSGEPKWPEVLADLLKTSGSKVSGWINPLASSPQATEMLIDFSDLIWIPEKIQGGMDEAIQVIRRSRHLLLGFPVVEFMEEASCMVKLAHEARVQVQVGHPDWYQPVFQSIRITESLPELLPGQGHQEVFKTIVADLDLALGMAGSTVRRVRPHASMLADGTALEIDVRVELHNGSVIHLTIRKFSKIPLRQMEVVQSDGIIRIDLLKETSTIEEYCEGKKGHQFEMKYLWPPQGNFSTLAGSHSTGDFEMARQCLSFIHALEKGRHPLSSLESGYKALEIARQVEISLGAL